MKRKNRIIVAIVEIVTVLLVCLTLAGCGKNDYQELKQEPDLVLYTPLTENIYEPIINEFEERTGLWVEVQEEMEPDIIEELGSSRDKFPGDVILGISKAAVLDNHILFPEKCAFSSASFVIIYNTNIVIYNEIPEKFSDLLDPKWEGKIGFLDPSTSAIYQGILNFIQNEAHQKYYIQMDRFYHNTEDYYADTMEDIGDGVSDGRYAVGIVTKRKAEQLIAEGKDIAYSNLSIDDCLISNMTVTTLNHDHDAVARQFLEFTKTEDVQKYLSQYLNYQSESASKEGNR